MEKGPVKRQPAPSISAALKRLPSSYVTLMGEFPLCPIRTNSDYGRAAAIIQRLALREDTLDAGEESAAPAVRLLSRPYIIGKPCAPL